MYYIEIPLVLFSTIASKNRTSVNRTTGNRTMRRPPVDDILCLSVAFWGARIGNFYIKTTDGVTVFAYWGQERHLEHINKLN